MHINIFKDTHCNLCGEAETRGLNLEASLDFLERPIFIHVSSDLAPASGGCIPVLWLGTQD